MSSPTERESAPTPVVIEGTVTCTECGAVFPGGTGYCAECGSTLEPSKPRPGNTGAARLRKEQQAALKGAAKEINIVTTVYRLAAACYVVATLFAVVALAREDVPRGGGILVVCMTTLMSVLFLLASAQIHFHPFAWTVAIAVLATVVSIVHIVGPDPYGIASIGSAAWAVLAWGGLVPSYRFRKLIESHKDLYILHHASADTRRSLRGRTAHDRHERLLRTMRRASRRAWRLSAAGAAVFALLTAAGAQIALSQHPVGFAPTLAKFESAWNDGGAAAVTELFDPRVREVKGARLEGLLFGHGWRHSPPELSDGQLREDDNEASVAYELDGIAVSASWVRSGAKWSLADVELPLPPIDAALAEFEEAWASSDPAAIVELFSEDARAEMLERIETAIEGRGWNSLPEILGTEVKNPGDGQATAKFSVEKGVLSTDWHYRTTGIWRLHGLRLPKR